MLSPTFPSLGHIGGLLGVLTQKRDSRGRAIDPCDFWSIAHAAVAIFFACVTCQCSTKASYFNSFNIMWRETKPMW